jgi:dihydrolipoamide dehydrogenase
MRYDITIIGSGPGGYVAAIKCAQLGMKVAIIEKYNTLGGTCLNVGCIPSKALLDSSEHFHTAAHKFAEHGIKISAPKVDMPQMIKRKSEVVDANVKGIDFLMKKNKIDVHNGLGSFVDKNHIKVTKADKSETIIETDKVIIATGSKPITPAVFNYDKKRVITSTEALLLQEVPKKMVVVGGGVIGMELGSVYARLGCEITVIEFLDRIIPGMDLDCAKELQKSMQGLGVKFFLGHGVSGVTSSKNGVKVSFKKNGTEDVQEIDADYCLVSIGRRAYTDGLGLENIGLALDEKGKIPINEKMETAVSGIYAIGDVVRGAMLAHKAEEEGVFVAETINGQHPHIHYKLIPGVVYTWPEVASVGHLEEELKEAGIPYKTGKFPYKALGRARASMDTEGFVKILAHKETDEILGMHIIGARAADLIQEGTTLMEFRASAEDAYRMSHPHPTYSEAIKEAALLAGIGKAIHM